MTIIGNGIDNTAAILAHLQGKRVALLTNSRSRSGDGRYSSLELLQRHGVDLTLLFAPEHGFTAAIEAGVAIADTPGEMGILPPCISLYGKNRRIPAEAMGRFDVLAVDLPDVGVRYYTYAATIFDALEDCAAAHKPVVLFDRPNPLGNATLEGPIIRREFLSEVGRQPVPVRHGMTLGQYAQVSIKYFGLAPGINLRVIPHQPVVPTALFPSFGQPWPTPSPNLRSFHALVAYVGTCLFEGTNLSEGRGTAAPFLQIGAPWLEPQRVLSKLPPLPGITLKPNTFTPNASKFAGEECQGIAITITDDAAARCFTMAIQLLEAIRQCHPEELSFLDGGHFDRLLGNSLWRLGQESTDQLLQRSQQECQDFQRNYQL